MNNNNNKNDCFGGIIFFQKESARFFLSLFAKFVCTFCFSIRFEEVKMNFDVFTMNKKKECKICSFFPLEMCLKFAFADAFQIIRMEIGMAKRSLEGIRANGKITKQSNFKLEKMCTHTTETQLEERANKGGRKREGERKREKENV